LRPVNGWFSVARFYVCHLRRALAGTPYSIINRFAQGFLFTSRPLDANKIAARKRYLPGH